MKNTILSDRLFLTIISNISLDQVDNSGVTDNAGINWDYSNPDNNNTLTNMIIIINNLSLVGAISEQQSVNFSFQI